MDRATHCVSRSLVSMLHSSRNKYVCITNLQHIEIIFQNVYTNATEGFFSFFNLFKQLAVLQRTRRPFATADYNT